MKSKLHNGLKATCQETVASSCCFWPWWQRYPTEARALHHRSEQTNLAQESEKLKEHLWGGGIPADPGAASHQQDELVDQEQCAWNAK